jgi:membrane fusion protein (multidrug efflux system)
VKEPNHGYYNRRRPVKSAAAAFALILSITFTSCGSSETTPATAPAPVVQVVAVQIDTVQIDKDFVGQVFGYRDIPIRARVEGFLEGIHFEEGRAVKKGQLLYTIDPEPLEAALVAAKSEQTRAEVTLVRAESDLKRVKPLSEINAVSKRDLDASVAEEGATAAMVDAARANVRINEIRLGYTRVEAPIDGIIGKTMAKVGEFVGRSPNPVILNTVSSVDSIHVEFFLTESDYLYFARQIKTDADKKATRANMPLRLVLSDGSVFEHTGRINFLNREIDVTTGTILVQATFPNPGRMIRPGQFARVRLVVDEIDDMVLVPQRCVTEVQGTHSVMVVDAEGNVEQRMVEIKDNYRDYFLVSQGLKPGERVVLEGLQRARSGGKVSPELVEFVSSYQKL